MDLVLGPVALAKVGERIKKLRDRGRPEDRKGDRVTASCLRQRLTPAARVKTGLPLSAANRRVHALRPSSAGRRRRGVVRYGRKSKRRAGKMWVRICVRDLRAQETHPGTYLRRCTGWSV